MSDTHTIDVPALAAELATVQQRKKELQDRETQLKAMLRGLGIGRHPAGNLNVSIAENRRLDEEKVRANYPSEMWPGFYVLKPQSETIKNSIPPAVYQQLMSPVGEPIVKVS